MRARITKTVLFLTLVGAMIFLGGPGTDAASAKPKRPPLYFEMAYRWGGDSIDDIVVGVSPSAELTLHSNGRFDAYDVFSGKYVANVGDWYKNRSRITLDLDNGTIYTGVLQPDGSYFGTVTGYLGNTGVWMGRFVSGF